jgi:hypothetical protein
VPVVTAVLEVRTTPTPPETNRATAPSPTPIATSGNNDDDDGDNDVATVPAVVAAVVAIPPALLVTVPITRVEPVTTTTALTTTILATDAVMISPTLFSPPLTAIVPDIDVPVYAEPSEDAATLQTIRAPLRLPVIQANSFWVEVGLPAGQTGWVQAWLLTYQGDARQLPLELRYLLVSEATTPVAQEQSIHLPYTYGTVVSVAGAEGYALLNDPNNEQSTLIRVPVGTDVTLLFEAKGSPAYGSGVWYFVSIVDPQGENLIWRGYLPAEVVAPR